MHIQYLYLFTWRFSFTWLVSPWLLILTLLGVIWFINEYILIWPTIYSFLCLAPPPPPLPSSSTSKDFPLLLSLPLNPLTAVSLTPHIYPPCLVGHLGPPPRSNRTVICSCGWGGLMYSVSLSDIISSIYSHIGIRFHCPAVWCHPLLAYQSPSEPFVSDYKWIIWYNVIYYDTKMAPFVTLYKLASPSFALTILCTLDIEAPVFF